MKDLLLACMILFAIIALPVGAQNETEMAFVAETDAGSQPEHSSSPDASQIDPLTETIFGGYPEANYASLDGNIPSEEFPEEDIAEDETSNNLNSLLISSGSESEGDSLDSGAKADNSGMENGSVQTTSDELNQTTIIFDQSETAILTQPEVPLGDQTTAVELGENEAFQAMRNVFSRNGSVNDFVFNSHSEENLTQITDIRNDLLNEWSRNRYAYTAYEETENQAGESAAYTDMASPEMEIERIRDQYSRLDPNFDILSMLADDTKNTNQNIAGILKTINSHMDKLQNKEPRDTDTSAILPYLRPFTPSDIIRIEAPYIAELDFANEDNEPEKYAVVVGINQYSDRRSLRASVNDADEMASLLELYGYEVIKLTDNTEMKPTKHNILDGAIKEIKMKQNRGNVVIYFSGHGEKDKDGNFYLITQNTSGNPDDYISKDELKEHIKDIKDLSLIVDTCYSGELASIKEDGQLILASSDNGEPSNEIWTRPNSVFTHSLCKAIRETGKWSDEIPLKSSFDKAQSETVRLARDYLQSQNPIMS